MHACMREALIRQSSRYVQRFIHEYSLRRQQHQRFEFFIEVIYYYCGRVSAVRGSRSSTETGFGFLQLDSGHLDEKEAD